MIFDAVLNILYQYLDRQDSCKDAASQRGSGSSLLLDLTYCLEVSSPPLLEREISLLELPSGLILKTLSFLEKNDVKRVCVACTLLYYLSLKPSLCEQFSKKTTDPLYKIVPANLGEQFSQENPYQLYKIVTLNRGVLLTQRQWALLIENSTYFQRLMEGDGAENQMRTLRLDNVTFQSLKKIVKCCEGYSIQFPNYDEASEILSLASLWDMSVQKEKIENYIKHNFSEKFNVKEVD